MSDVDGYIAKLESKQAKIVEALRLLIASNFPQLSEEFKWSQPVYTLNGKDVAYIRATQRGANFGLTKGALLSDPKNALEGTGKEMRHVKVSNLEELDTEYLTQLLNQATGNL